MLNILTCVDQSYAGVFLIDSTNSKQFSEEFLSSNIACAFERQHFFDSTIMYNLKVFNDNLEDKIYIIYVNLLVFMNIFVN